MGQAGCKAGCRQQAICGVRVRTHLVVASQAVDAGLNQNQPGNGTQQERERERRSVAVTFAQTSSQPICLAAIAGIPLPPSHRFSPELAVLVLAVALQVLPDGHSLLDQEVQVLGQLRGQTAGSRRAGKQTGKLKGVHKL